MLGDDELRTFDDDTSEPVMDELLRSRLGLDRIEVFQRDPGYVRGKVRQAGWPLLIDALYVRPSELSTVVGGVSHRAGQLLQVYLALPWYPRFAGGVRGEFESARSELRTGTAVARKQAVHECGCAVESAMKVLLAEQAPSPAQATPRRAVRAPGVGRARTAPHGACHARARRSAQQGGLPRRGAIAHNVSVQEAEAIVAATAGAIAYLGKLLPPPPAPARRSARARLARR